MRLLLCLLFVGLATTVFGYNEMNDAEKFRMRLVEYNKVFDPPWTPTRLPYKVMRYTNSDNMPIAPQVLLQEKEAKYKYLALRGFRRAIQSVWNSKNKVYKYWENKNPSNIAR